MRSFVTHLAVAFVVIASSTLGSAQAHHLPCDREDSLVGVARQIARSAELPRGLEVQEALREAGSDLPTAEIARFGVAHEQAARSWLESRRERARGTLVCGHATVGKRSVLVVGDRLGALLARRDGSFDVALHPEVSTAYGFALTRAGEVRYAPVRAERLRFDDGETLLSVQLVGQSSDGPRPIARWERPGAKSVDLDSDQTDLHAWLSQLQARSYQNNALHRAARKNRRLDDAALRYAQTLCAEGRVSHSLDGEGAVSRVAAQGLVARDIGEVLVRAPSLSTALTALLQSPSHRLVLLDRRMTDVGFGIETRDGDVCVVGLFASWPRPR